MFNHLFSSGQSLQVLAQELPGLITAITFPRTMRWDSDSSYSRPLRWLVALHGAASVNFTAAGVASGTTTRVLRKDKQPVREVTDVKSHLKTLVRTDWLCSAYCFDWRRP